MTRQLPREATNEHIILPNLEEVVPGGGTKPEARHHKINRFFTVFTRYLSEEMDIQRDATYVLSVIQNVIQVTMPHEACY